MRNEDFLFDEVEPMETSTSGVCCKLFSHHHRCAFLSLVFAVNEGCEKLELVRDSGWVNQYVVNGVLGEETNKNMIRSKVVGNMKYGNLFNIPLISVVLYHVSRNQLEKLLSRIRHQFRRLSYELSNVDLQSEEAFEIAQSGAARPKVLGTPIIYDVQTLQFEPPRFQLKIICTNENDYFLR